jgi:hypothetical protein
MGADADRLTVAQERAWWTERVEALADHLGLEAVHLLGLSPDDQATYVLLDAVEAINRFVTERTR